MKQKYNILIEELIQELKNKQYDNFKQESETYIITINFKKNKK